MKAQSFVVAAVMSNHLGYILQSVHSTLQAGVQTIIYHFTVMLYAKTKKKHNSSSVQVLNVLQPTRPNKLKIDIWQAMCNVTLLVLTMQFDIMVLHALITAIHAHVFWDLFSTQYFIMPFLDPPHKPRGLAAIGTSFSLIATQTFWCSQVLECITGQASMGRA